MTFKTKNGRAWHIAHETRSAPYSRITYTICGKSFDDGERSSKASPTCQKCLERDDPLLQIDERSCLNHTRMGTLALMGPNDRRYMLERLEGLDLVTRDGRLTRRGAILAEDYASGAVPLPDKRGVNHRRLALRAFARCNDRVLVQPLDGEYAVTVDRYAKLRAVYAGATVTCMPCLCLGPKP